MEGLYKINLVPCDLSTEETIMQIADTLDNLNGIVEDVFARLNLRVEQNKEKALKLCQRVESSRAKVEKLTGIQTAIKVFSSAKYPASITHEHYQSVFDLNGYTHKPQKITLSRKCQGMANEKQVQERLHFFHVKVGKPKSPEQKPDFDLKTVVDNLSTVGELLVFNTDESPYLGNKTKAPAYVPAVASAQNTSSLEEAPSSIMKREVLKREIDEYMYAPGMGMVPELEMPTDLPDLPGIAGDVQFSIAQDGSIAPSAVTSPVAPVKELVDSVYPDLPDIADLREIKDLPDVKDLPDIKDLPDVSVTLDIPVVPVELSARDLPPPPPPLPPPPPMEPPTPKETIKREQAPSQPVGDAHSSLMAAIRQAGGAGRAKLRPAASSTPTKPASGGDLMADLHAKLSMRRRGISGAERGGSVLHTLASVIPEPGECSPQQSSSGDEWE